VLLSAALCADWGYIVRGELNCEGRDKNWGSSTPKSSTILTSVNSHIND